MKLEENHSWKSHHSCSQKQFCLSKSSNCFGFFFLIFLLFKDLSVNIDNVAFKLLCIVTLTHKSAIAAGNLIWIKSKCLCERMLLTGKYMKIVITCSNAMTQIYPRLVWNTLTHPTCTNCIRCSPSIAIYSILEDIFLLMISISLKISLLRQIHRGILKEAASVDSNISFLFPPLSSWQLPLFPDPFLLWEYTKTNIPVLTHPPKIGREMSLCWRKKWRGHACPKNLQTSELHPPSSWEDPFRNWFFGVFS